MPYRRLSLFYHIYLLAVNNVRQGGVPVDPPIVMSLLIVFSVIARHLIVSYRLPSDFYCDTFRSYHLGVT